MTSTLAEQIATGLSRILMENPNAVRSVENVQPAFSAELHTQGYTISSVQIFHRMESSVRSLVCNRL